MDAIKVEPDSDGETFESHVNIEESDSEKYGIPEPFAFAAVKEEVEHSMDVIKEEPGSHEEACKTEYYNIHVKSEEQFLQITFPVVKTEGTLDPHVCVEVKIEPDIEIGIKDNTVGEDGVRSEELSSQFAALPTDAGNYLSERPHKCSECGISFPTFSGLQKHSYKHKPKSFSCDVCGQSFYQFNSLKTHSLVHTDGKPFLCEICGKGFLQASNLRLHTLKHKGVKSHECELCQKRFFHAGALKNHYMIHSGVKPYECKICNRSFNHAGNLKTHMLVHTREKPFQCTVCGKGFAVRHALASHQNLHTGEKPFKCDVCSRQFRHRHSLINHQKLHTGDKPYECDICQKRFAIRGNLMRHINTHERNYACTFCPRIYGDAQAVKDHVASEHSDGHKEETIVGV